MTASLLEPAPPLAGPPVRGVLVDFYGTLAHSTGWRSAAEVLAARGYVLDEEARRRSFEDGIDGVEHLEQSRSRDHYVAWQRERTIAMLTESDVHPGEHDEIVAELRAGATERVLSAYPEVPEVLAALRERGLAVVVCSNWDWDLEEAVRDAGLLDAVDVLVSSAWAGARKPHPRIYAHTLAACGLDADECLFVGDTWGPDVEGPLAAGLRPLYLRRDGHWPDATCPHDQPLGRGVPVGRDLRAVLELLEA